MKDYEISKKQSKIVIRKKQKLEEMVDEVPKKPIRCQETSSNNLKGKQIFPPSLEFNGIMLNPNLIIKETPKIERNNYAVPFTDCITSPGIKTLNAFSPMTLAQISPCMSSSIPPLSLKFEGNSEL